MNKTKPGNDCKWFYVILSAPHLILGWHATFICNIFFYFICFFLCMPFQNRVAFFFKPKVENTWQVAGYRVAVEADIMHCGNYRNKMNACRFWKRAYPQMRPTNTTEMKILLPLINRSGWFLYYLHTLDNRRWRFSNG